MTIGPVLAGTALAWAEHAGFSPATALATTLAALFIQIGCNLQNDAGGFARGADRFARPGPPRATTLGWLAPEEVQIGAAVSFVLATIVGAALVAQGGWPILLVGVTAIAIAVLYMAGPRPISYSSASEALVLIFFGIVPVGGSYYLQTHTVSLSAWLAGTALGLISAAVLAVNNYRDMDADRRNGRHTLAVRFGAHFCRAEYVLLLTLTMAMILLLAIAVSGWYAITLSAALPATLLGRRIQRTQSGATLNALLRDTVVLSFIIALLLVAAAALRQILP